MAREAEFGLLALEHDAHAGSVHCAFVLTRGVHIVAIGATDTGAEMLAQLAVALFAGALVAVEAGLRHFVGGFTLHCRDRADFAACGQVLRGITVAIFTRHATLPGFGMRRHAVGSNFVLVTFHAFFRIGLGALEHCVLARHILGGVSTDHRAFARGGVRRDRGAGRPGPRDGGRQASPRVRNEGSFHTACSQDDCGTD